jgi:hypothetical protein
MYINSIMSITLKNGAILDNLLDLNPTINTFYLEDGEYFINKVLHIEKPNIKIIGLTNASTIHIKQKNILKDGISAKFADYFEMRNVSVHVEHNDKVCFTVASCNNTKVEDCYFYGNHNTFCVYYAGPSTLIEGSNTLMAYRNNKLDNYNVFRRNVVYSQWSGDNISFSLQNKGLFTYNIIRGGKLAVYMCRNSWVTCNRIYDSNTNGIFVSLPTHYTQIKHNILYECEDSAIAIRNQVEHGTFTKTPYHILIKDNYVYDSKDNSIELNDLSTAIVDGNTFISTDIYGLYCLRCDNLSIINNKISEFKVAAWLERTSNCLFENNNILSIFPNYGNNVVKITNASNNNTIRGNKVSGKINYDLVPISNDSTGLTVLENIVVPYYTYADELKVMRK